MAVSAIELDEKVAAMLRSQAAARELPLAEFLQQLAFSNAPVNSPEALSDEEWVRAIEEVSDESPSLPSDFSRADIYSDHD